MMIPKVCVGLMALMGPATFLTRADLLPDLVNKVFLTNRLRRGPQSAVKPSRTRVFCNLRARACLGVLRIGRKQLKRSSKRYRDPVLWSAYKHHG